MLKKYMILHIESGNYLEIIKVYQDWTISNKIDLPIFVSFGIASIKEVGITKRDYGFYNTNRIYFKDRATAQTFLRDLFIPEYNEVVDTYKMYYTPNTMKKHNRNMYEIVELDNV